MLQYFESMYHRFEKYTGEFLNRTDDIESVSDLNWICINSFQFSALRIMMVKFQNFY